MKNIFLFFTLSSAIILTSCEGDRGPQGPPGGVEYAKVFEVNVTGYQYDAGVNQLYSSLFTYPFSVYESDAVLAYRLSGTDDTVNPPGDVWTQLPQSVFYNDGTGDFFQYNYNYSFLSVQFTIEGNFPLSNIDPIDARNQVFRIAVVPAEFAKTNPPMDRILEVMRANDGKIERLEPLEMN